MNSKKQTIEVYSKNAKYFADKFNQVGPRTADIDKAFSYVNKPNPAVVELGCGNGRDALEILKKTKNYLGMDAAEGLIIEAKKLVPNANFVVSDFDSFEFSGEVDIIFAFASLLHANPKTLVNVFKKASKSLNKNGVFFISLKYAKHYIKEEVSELGVRTFYYYEPSDIKFYAKSLLAPVWEDVQDFRGQKWFSIILQK